MGQESCSKCGLPTAFVVLDFQNRIRSYCRDCGCLLVQLNAEIKRLDGCGAIRKIVIMHLPAKVKTG